MSTSSKISVGTMVSLGQHVFQRQHDARQLAARGDLAQRLERLAEVGGHVERNGVHAVLRQIRLREAAGKLYFLHIQLGQLVQHARRQGL